MAVVIQRFKPRHRWYPFVAFRRSALRNFAGLPEAGFREAGVSGLHLNNDFLTEAEELDICREVTRVFSLARSASALIAKPVRSQSHNLPFDEHFKRVNVPAMQACDQMLACEYFDKYGDQGHELIYFSRGPLDSVPNFVQSLVVDRIRDILALLPATSEKGKLVHPSPDAFRDKWRLTLNHYSNSGAADRPGFPFHKDIRANGDVTMILTLGSSATMELAQETEPHVPTVSVKLHPRSLLLLSNEARWRRVHCVLPVASPAERSSLVLGWRAP
ncbi:unnamed protein product [Effrenium voratum]|nr:unnamed protein product [Effrenium voratum]